MSPERTCPVENGSLAERLRLMVAHMPAPASPMLIQQRMPASPSLKTIRSTLKQLAVHAQVHPWPPDAQTAGRQARYWHTALDTFFDDQLMATVADGAMTRRELQKSLKRRMMGCADAHIKRQLARALPRLLAKQSLFRHPPCGRRRAARFSRHRPAPGPYLQPTREAFRKIGATWRKAGLPVQTLLDHAIQDLTCLAAQAPSLPAITPPLVTPPGEVKSPTDRIMQTIPVIEPAAHQQALVSIPLLRKALAMAKAEFDTALMELAGNGRIWLHKHIDPAQLSEAEKQALVSPDNKTYYMGLVLRGSHG